RAFEELEFSEDLDRGDSQNMKPITNISAAGFPLSFFPAPKSGRFSRPRGRVGRGTLRDALLFLLASAHFPFSRSRSQLSIVRRFFYGDYMHKHNTGPQESFIAGWLTCRTPLWLFRSRGPGGRCEHHPARTAFYA